MRRENDLDDLDEDDMPGSPPHLRRENAVPKRFNRLGLGNHPHLRRENKKRQKASKSVKKR